MIKVAGFAAVVAFVVGCGGVVAPNRDTGACSGTADVSACEDCVAHPPRGEAGTQACQSQGIGTCCATTQADGSCFAMYSDPGLTLTATCGPITAASQ